MSQRQATQGVLRRTAVSFSDRRFGERVDIATGGPLTVMGAAEPTLKASPTACTRKGPLACSFALGTLEH
eukprot:9467584-Pyramimonas_sp.AAC.4